MTRAPLGFSLLVLAVLGAVLVAGPAAAGGTPSFGGTTTLVAAGDLRTNLVPRMYALDRAGVRRDLGGLGGDTDPAVSPDGKSLAFVSARDGFPAIYISNVDGSHLHRLTSRIDCVASEAGPQWSPDGTRIAFEYDVATLCVRGPAPSPGRLAGPRYTVRQVHPLAVVDLRGDLRTFTVSGWSPVWSPDATRLAYVEENRTSVTGGAGTTSGVLDVATGVHWSLGKGTDAEWAVSGDAVALPSGGGLVRVFAESGRLVRAVRARGAAWTRCGLVTSRRGAAVASADGGEAAFRTATGVAVRRCGGHVSTWTLGAGEPVAFSPSGRQLLVRGCRRTVCELRIVSARRTIEVRKRAQPVRPLWAPDGQAVAFVSVGGSVILADGGTGKTIVGQSDEPRSQIALAGWQDADTVVYGSRTSVPTSALYRVTLATGAAKRLVPDAWMPAAGPDKGALAFARAPGIWLWDAARGAHLLVRTLGSNTASGFAWSPDGRTIAYSTQTIGLVTLDGTTRSILTLAAVIRVTAWSPDGRWLAYTANGGVWLVHPDGTDNHRFAAQASELQWSPDGSRVAYLTNSTLVVAAADNSDARAVATGIEPTSIAWSRDGTQIFATRIVNRWPLGSLFTRLVAVAADGSGETPITDGAGYITGVTGPA